MRRALVWLLVFSTGLSGCALRRDAATAPSPAASPSVQARLDAYPSGTPVRLGLAGGERVEGVLIWVDPETVSIETARDTAPRVIPRASVVEVSDRTTAEHRVRTAKSWAVIGLAAAATVVFLGYILALAGCAASGDCG
jgi:hypothetical protein